LKFKSVDTVTILPYSLYFEKSNSKGENNVVYDKKRINETLLSYGDFRKANHRCHIGFEQIKKNVQIMKPKLNNFKQNIYEVLSWFDQSLIEEL